MCGAQNASEFFCIAEIRWDIAVKQPSGNLRNRAAPRYKEGPLGKTNGPSLGRKRPRWATTHRPNRTCRMSAYGLVRGAVQLRPTGSGCILAHMLPACTDHAPTPVLPALF